MTSLPPSSLAVRHREPEVMDDPGLDAAAHRGALDGLARINRWSGTAARIWRGVRTVPVGPRPPRVLDVACGGGDVAVAVALRARAAGRTLEVTGCDVSERALERGRERARRAGVEVEWVRGRAPDDLPAGPFDVAYTTLFLHHLSDEEAVDLLAALASRARRVIAEDLRRSRAGLALARLAGRVLAPSPVVRVDGERSVRAAFTLDEARALASAAGLEGARVTGAWPQRWSLTWDAP